MANSKSDTGDITVDQEHSSSTTPYLGASEELRLLRTEVEEKLKHMEERLDGLQQKQIADSEQQKTDQKAHNATVDQGMNQLKEQIAKVAENVNIVALAVSKIGLTTRNRWDIAACHEDLSLIGPERLIVHYTGAFNGYRSVFAVEPIRKLDFGICYYEVKILKKNDIVCIGLATKQTPLLGPFRDHEGTFGYDGSGIFWGHAFSGCKRNRQGRPIIIGNPSFDKNDVVGCGVNLTTREIIYTKNGERLATEGLVVSTDDLFPCVSMNQKGVKIEANFRKFRC
ncbi:Ran-binding protein 9 [Globodera pallida]|nr:Ran-binding protein 9 [Globodera pallida]